MTFVNLFYGSCRYRIG